MIPQLTLKFSTIAGRLELIYCLIIQPLLKADASEDASLAARIELLIVYYQ